jgi:Bacteriophage tail sheath protein
VPISPTYPGVYIEEVPSAVHPITGVATSIAAFVDFFKRGPMNEAVQVFSFADFEREFGGLDSHSEASYGIQQFFLNGGSECWVVRVGSTDGTNAPTKASVVVQRAASAPAALTLTARSEGEWGNGLLARIDFATSDPTKLFNLTVFELSAATGRPVVVAQEEFRQLSMAAADARFVESIVNDGSSLVEVTANGTDLPAASGSETTADFAKLDKATHKTKVKLDYHEGTPTSEELDVDLSEDPIDTVDEAAARLEAAIRAINPSNPAWAGTTVRAVGKRLQILAGPSRSATVATFSDAAGDTQTTSKLSLPSTGNVTAYSLGSALASIAGTKQGATVRGQDGIPPNALDLIGSNAVDPPRGLFALDKVDLFNILCLPRIGRVDGTNAFDPDQVGNVISNATDYCERRRAFLLVDTPNDTRTVPQFKQLLSDTLDARRHKNAAAYFPRLISPDPLDDFRPRSFGASGAIAGLFARTDAARGVWKAPAGTEASLRNVQRLEAKLSDAENGVLNPLGINCLRTFSVYGHVCWGSRTLVGSDQQASEWKYVPVRRLALFLEESLYRGTKWVVFEPNDEPLWGQIRLNVGAFLHDLFRQGAFQGKTPREAYLVKCDSETTTQTDIDHGVVNIVVGFAPLKPAEFVIIRIQQLAGQIET